MAVYANTPIELVNAVYGTLDDRLAKGRERLGRALTLTEKILINHLDDVDNGGNDDYILKTTNDKTYESKPELRQQKVRPPRLPESGIMFCGW